MDKRAAVDNGGEIVRRFPGDRGVAELLVRASTGFDKRTGWHESIEVLLPTAAVSWTIWGEVSGTIMTYP
jgi:hypothetical protein